ncbi:MAG: hypothetical protein R2708_05150 [Vicinamibacterales bacterium]
MTTEQARPPTTTPPPAGAAVEGGYTGPNEVSFDVTALINGGPASLPRAAHEPVG